MMPENYILTKNEVKFYFVYVGEVEGGVRRKDEQ